MPLRTVLIALFFLVVSVFPAAARQPVAFARDVLAIESTGASHRFFVEIAQTPEQQEQGLMHRMGLADNRGMLFVNRRERVMKMWMKNTPVALDMLFIDKRGKVVYIAPRTTPYSLESIGPDSAVLAVLELKGGVCERLGIHTGDTVIHSFFTP